jgi:hypothetical protein
MMRVDAVRKSTGLIVVACFSVSALFAGIPAGYKGTPFHNNQTVVNKAIVPNSCHGDQSDGLRWHRWNKIMNLAEITFPDSGLQLLTFEVTYPDPNQRDDPGNFDYIEFVPKAPTQR